MGTSILRCPRCQIMACTSPFHHLPSWPIGSHCHFSPLLRLSPLSLAFISTTRRRPRVWLPPPLLLFSPLLPLSASLPDLPPFFPPITFPLALLPIFCSSPLQPPLSAVSQLKLRHLGSLCSPPPLISPDRLPASLWSRD